MQSKVAKGSRNNNNSKGVIYSWNCNSNGGFALKSFGMEIVIGS